MKVREDRLERGTWSIGLETSEGIESSCPRAQGSDRFDEAWRADHAPHKRRQPRVSCRSIGRRQWRARNLSTFGREQSRDTARGIERRCTSVYRCWPMAV